MGEPYLLLGFDAREMWLPGGGWDERRKSDFLFRLDVDKPFSIDRAVWRSVIDFHPEVEPSYTGLFTGLWESLQHLEDCLDTAETEIGHCLVATFGVSLTACDALERQTLDDFLTGVGPDGLPAESGPLSALAEPSAVDDRWRFFGYDVADLAGTSALMNMGFLPGYDDTETLRARWAPDLNALHLFEDHSRAEEFKRYSNRRVAEHAPFYVVGIWRVKEWSPSSTQ